MRRPRVAEDEFERRAGMWAELVAAGGPRDVPPALLRDLGIYGGAQGIWIDAAYTSAMTSDGAGITVGLLHTGRHYADDLTEDSLLYHYPRTQRLGRRDAYEIAATKNAATLGIELFVIAPGSQRRLRTVHRGRIVGWDDELALFRVALGDAGPDLARPSQSDRTAPRTSLGSKYRRADEEAAAAPRDPFTIDPDKIDRGLRGHATTQNRLSEWLASVGADVRSPSIHPVYDIAWELRGALYVGEVKSLTRTNEAQQVRLGLGQVLDYAFVLSGALGRQVQPVLVLEGEPWDGRWLDLCGEHGVRLVWPDRFDSLLAD